MGPNVNPIWIALAISAVGMVVTWILAYHASRRGTEVAIARMEERHSALKERVVDVEEVVERHSLSIQDHALRLGHLENAMDVRPPPSDFPRRGRT